MTENSELDFLGGVPGSEVQFQKLLPGQSHLKSILFLWATHINIIYPQSNSLDKICEKKVEITPIAPPARNGTKLMSSNEDIRDTSSRHDQILI